MKLPYTNLSITEISNTLGTSDRTLRGLCTNNNINIFSWRKPFAYAANVVDSNDYEAMRGKNHGFKYSPILAAPELGAELPEIVYQPPIGGTNEPFRMGDFRGYEHDALPCINLNIEHMYTTTTASRFKLTYTQTDANLALSTVVGNSSPFRIVLIYKNANRVRAITSPLLVKDMQPHETYTLEMQGILADEGLLTDFYVCMTTKEFPDAKDITWGSLGGMIALNWQNYKEYHKRYTIVGLPKELIKFDEFELWLTNHIGRIWICKPVLYFSPSVANTTITFNAADYYIKFYCEYRFRDINGKMYNNFIVDIIGSWTTNSTEQAIFDIVQFPFDEVDSSQYPKAPVYMDLYKRGTDGAKDKIVYQKEIDFHDIRK